jgi:hypothetical protein
MTGIEQPPVPSRACLKYTVRELRTSHIRDPVLEQAEPLNALSLRPVPDIGEGHHGIPMSNPTLTASDFS